MCAQSFPTLCNPMNCSLPVSSIHGVLQARILEWVAISFSRESSQARDQTHIFCVSCIGGWVLHQLSHQGSLQETTSCYKITSHSLIINQDLESTSKDKIEYLCAKNCQN